EGREPAIVGARASGPPPIEEGLAEMPFPHAKVRQLRRRGQDSQRARVVFGRHGRPVYSIQLKG
ncbi:MAG TPA: hypothetical protein VNQ15_13815, partial [Verrucomicrobiae bacterium]|nr:hypothetical protein [Verrucomicrobiae bacterium]